MEAPHENLEAIHSLAKKSSQDHMSPAHAAFVVHLFGGYVQDMIDMNEDIILTLRSLEPKRFFQNEFPDKKSRSGHT